MAQATLGMGRGGDSASTSIASSRPVSTAATTAPPIVSAIRNSTVSTGALALSALADAPRLRRVEVREVGDDLWERYERI